MSFFYSETLVTGEQGKYLKGLLAATAVLFLLWNISLWVKPPVNISFSGGELSDKAERGYTVRSLSHKASYNDIVKKDLFMATRMKYEDAVTGVAQNNLLPVVAMAPPQATLLGTVLLHGEEAALISIHGQPDGPNYYKVGDRLGGFVVKEIGTSSVLLMSGGQTFEIGLTPLDKEIENTQINNKKGQAAQRQRRLAPNRLKRGQKPQRFKGRTAPPL